MFGNHPSRSARRAARIGGGRLGQALWAALVAVPLLACWLPESISAESSLIATDNHWPRVASLEPPRTPAAARARMVRYAAGAVQFILPDEWSARTVPHEREMRLVLSPAGALSGGPPTNERVWMTYHAVGRTEEPYRSELERWLPARLSLQAAQPNLSGPPRQFEVDRWPAVAQACEYQPAESATPWMGQHVLVRTDWGIVELHAASPKSGAERLAEEFNRLLDGLQLAAPLSPVESIHNAANLATPALGTWRSPSGMMRLHGSARIEVVPDRPAWGAPARPGELSPSRIMTGRFSATQDTLLVTWEDGSQTNMRWKLVHDELRLVDHDGRTSRLKRILE